MKTTDFRFWALMLLIACLIVAVAPVWATGEGDRHTSNTDVNVDVGGDTVNVGGDTVNVGGSNVNVGGDTISMQGGDLTSGPVNVSTGGNKSVALGNVLGDVDIAGCLGSTQWSTPVYGKQKLVVNWVCVAEFYLQYQQPELAAMALCNTEILKEFETEEECEQAHQFLTQAVLPPPPVATAPDHDEEEDYHAEQMMLYEDMQAKIRNLEERKPVQKTVIEQKPFLSDEQRAKLRELKQ